ncbi:MAG TPA: FG-GAP-like repeat-containing protein [Chryseolinea sp.]|nr:FG-GAP-like repeat-containing protein [Chryseolinea sp.]
MHRILKLKLVLLILSGLALSSYGQSFVQTSDSFLSLYNGRIEWADLDQDSDLDLIYSGFSEGANEYFTKVYENINGSFVARNTALPNLRNGTFALGDYNKDGDLDVLLSGLSELGNISVLYENNGAFSFSMKSSFPGLINSTTSWFDIDNDGDLDFLIAGVDDNTGGMDPFVEKMLVYENTGTNFTLIPDTNLPPCTQCSMDWADSNRDGKMDLIITGFGEDSPRQTNLYLNNGNKTFKKDEDATFKDVNNGDVKWGDFDNDGDMDVLLSGILEDGNIIATVYDNTGGQLREREDIQIKETGENWLGGTKWVDYNNDGHLDILVTGRGTSVLVLEYVFRLFKNNGDGTFQEVSETNFGGLAVSSVDFGDFDNDGDVDFCFSGINRDGPTTGIYENKLFDGVMVANNKPTPPAIGGFSEEYFFRKQVTLKWNNGADSQTPPAGLSYNFYLKNGSVLFATPTSNFITGYLLTSNPANGHAKRAILNNIHEGNNAWAVQTIDGSKSGSLFSAEKSFYQIHGPETIKAEIIDVENIKLSWLDNSSIETLYRIVRSTDPSVNFSLIATLPQNSISHVDNHAFLTDTYYYYRVNAANATKASAYDSLRVLIPTAPTGLSTQSLNASKINLTWEDHSNYESGYGVERKLSTGGSFEIIATLAADTESYTDTGLNEGTSYDYRVRAVNEYGGSASSNVSSARTNFRPLGSNFGKEMHEDQTLSFSVQDYVDVFSDPDLLDALVEISIKTLPQKGTLKLSSVPVVVGQTIALAELEHLKYIPFSNENGVADFNFYNNDGKDNSAISYTVTITIIPVNDVPAFTSPEMIELLEDFTNKIKISSNPEPIPPDELPQVVTYSIQPATSSKVNINFNSSTGELNFTSVPNESGEVEFTITANDGQSENNTFSRLLKLVIKAVNDAPALSIIPDQLVEYQTEIPSINFMVTDVDDPVSSILLSANSNNQLLVRNDKITIGGGPQEKTIDLIPDENGLGSALITIIADDGKATASVSFKFEIIPITAVSESVSTEIKVYPNPTNSFINVSIGGHFDSSMLIVRDLLGREISRRSMGENTLSIDLGDFADGIYMLNITGDKGEILLQKKVIKN